MQTEYEAPMPDDTEVAEILRELGEGDKLGGLIDAIAYGHVHGDWSQAKRWVDNAVADAMQDRREAADAKLQADSPVSGRGYRLREP
jgi:hypothetical protein